MSETNTAMAEDETRMYGATVTDLLERWDRGDTIWSVELGGLGPGYEQAIQTAAIEFARAGQAMPRTDDEKADYKAFDDVCMTALQAFDKDLGGLSGAMFGAAKWLAWQWCFNGGPAGLVKRAREQKRDTIQVSKRWPRA